jgi:hypothetical protein
VRRQIVELDQEIQVAGAVLLPGGGTEDVEPRDTVAAADRGHLRQTVGEDPVHDRHSTAIPSAAPSAHRRCACRVFAPTRREPAEVLCQRANAVSRRRAATAQAMRLQGSLFRFGLADGPMHDGFASASLRPIARGLTAEERR